MKKAAAYLFCIAVAGNLWGLNLEPLSMSFSTSGRQSIKTFRVANDQDQPIAVRIYMTTRELMPDGSEERKPADSDFTVFPQRLFLVPGQNQAVRVQWKGLRSAESELAYRIIAEQLPVKDGNADSAQALERGGVALNFLYRFVGAVYVTPENARENIILKGVFPAENSGNTGSNRVELHFENTGTSHAIITNGEIAVYAVDSDGVRKASHVINGEELKVLSGVNFLASASLTETIDLPEGFDRQNIEVEFSFETSR